MIKKIVTKLKQIYQQVEDLYYFINTDNSDITVEAQIDIIKGELKALIENISKR